MPEQEITITKTQLEDKIQTALAMEQIKTLRFDFKHHVSSGQELLKDIQTQVREIPRTIMQCRDELKDEIHEEAEAKFVTQVEFEKFKGEVFSKMDKLGLKITLPLATLMVVLQVYNVFFTK